MAQRVKNLPASQRRGHKRFRFDFWVGKIPWRRKCNPLQYSCLESPMERGVWWATVHGVAKLDTTEHMAHIDLESQVSYLLK